MPTKLDLIGNTYSGILVELPAKRTHKSTYYYVCKCHCGDRFITEGSRLHRGLTTSCGCLRRHGMIDSGEYRAWASMKRRCLNPNTRYYERYGGRGITVCERWMSFKNFIQDMGPKPSPDLTLDRTDNNRGYSLDNCRWATRTVQQANRRNTKQPKPCASCGQPFIYKATPRQRCCSHRCRGQLIKDQSQSRPLSLFQQPPLSSASN